MNTKISTTPSKAPSKFLVIGAYVFVSCLIACFMILLISKIWFDWLPEIKNPAVGKVVFVGKDDIFIVNADGSMLQKLTDDEFVDFDPSFSPNGEKIAFLSFRDEECGLFTMDTNGSNLQRVAQYKSHANRCMGDHYEWSPNGNRFVLQYLHDIGIVGLGVMNADGSNFIKIVEDCYKPQWAPDGNKILCLDGYSDGRVFIINADGTNPIYLDMYTFYASWSPDGTRIASNIGGLEIANADGTNLTRVSYTGPTYGGSEAAPAWSPDGNRVIFVGDEGIYLSFLDGSEGDARLILRNQATDDSGYHEWRSQSGSWSPDGNWIVYEERKGDVTAINIFNVNTENYKTLVDFGTDPVWSP